MAVKGEKGRIQGGGGGGPWGKDPPHPFLGPPKLHKEEGGGGGYSVCFSLIVCFTSYFVFSIAVLPHSPGVVYFHLLLRQETRIPGVAPFSFRSFCA